jgi:hypothetical protein
MLGRIKSIQAGKEEAAHWYETEIEMEDGSSCITAKLSVINSTRKRP